MPTIRADSGNLCHPEFLAQLVLFWQQSIAPHLLLPWWEFDHGLRLKTTYRQFVLFVLYLIYTGCMIFTGKFFG